MPMCDVISVEYRKNFQIPYVQNGFKRGMRPRGGDKVVCGPNNGLCIRLSHFGMAQIIVTLRLGDGTAYPLDVGPDFRRILGCAKIYEKDVLKLRERMPRSVSLNDDAYPQKGVREVDLQNWFVACQ